MKVLYLIDTLEGYGAEKSIVEIAVNFKEIEPVFVHLYPGDKLISFLKNSGIKVYSLNIKSKHGYNQAVKLLSPIIEEEKPQIIHSSLHKADMVARRLKKKYPKILLVGSFISNSYSNHRFRQLPFLSKLKIFNVLLKDRLSAGKVDFFISNSYAILSSNLNVLNVPKEKTEVIYRGRYIEGFISYHNQDVIKNELNLNNKKVFLNIGRLHYGKGQKDLINAFSKLKFEQPDLVLLIAGGGKYQSILEMEIMRLNLKESVHLLGYRDDIPQLLSIADYFVFPTYYEGLPGALIEAVLAKKPIIASDIEENRECLAKDAALFFPPGNVDLLKSQMEKALSMENWGELIDRSYYHAQNNFEISNISKKYEDFYKKILHKFKT